MNASPIPWIDAHVRGRRVALVVGIVALAVCAIASVWNLQVVLRSYLCAWLFALSLSLGSLAALMMYHLTGGGWGLPVRRYFESAAAQVPLLAVLFVPIALGFGQLFPWAGSSAKHWYLNGAFFIARAVAYLAAWIVLALLLERSARAERRAGRLSAVGLLVYGVTVTFAAVDWIGSLVPRWSSTALGMIVIVGQGLGAFAFAVASAARMQLILERGGPVSQEHARHAPVELTADRGNDLGNLLLSFVMTWMYLVFVQFLIIWAEDLPRETVWYVIRSRGIWPALAIVLIVGQFVLPFSLLLFRRVKRSVRALLGVALLSLAAHWLDVAWLVLPSTSNNGEVLHWSAFVTTLGVGGVWLWGCWRHLLVRPSFAHAGFDAPAETLSAEAHRG